MAGTRHLYRSIVAISAAMILSTCDKLFEVGLGDEVDITPPSIEILSPVNGQFVTGLSTF